MIIFFNSVITTKFWSGDKISGENFVTPSKFSSLSPDIFFPDKVSDKTTYISDKAVKKSPYAQNSPSHSLKSLKEVVLDHDKTRERREFFNFFCGFV